MKILDIGGTDYFWTTLELKERFNWQIDLLNNSHNDHANISFNYLLGDGKDLSIIPIGY